MPSQLWKLSNAHQQHRFLGFCYSCIALPAPISVSVTYGFINKPPQNLMASTTTIIYFVHKPAIRAELSEDSPPLTHAVSTGAENSLPHLIPKWLNNWCWLLVLFHIVLSTAWCWLPHRIVPIFQEIRSRSCHFLKTPIWKKAQHILLVKYSHSQKFQEMGYTSPLSMEESQRNLGP